MKQTPETDYASPEYRESVRKRLRENHADLRRDEPQVADRIERLFEDVSIDLLIALARLRDEVSEQVGFKDGKAYSMRAWDPFFFPVSLLLSEMITASVLNSIGPFPPALMYLLDLTRSSVIISFEDALKAGTIGEMQKNAAFIPVGNIAPPSGSKH